MQNILREESYLISECLDISSQEKVLGIVQQILISDQSQRILNHSHFETFMKENRIDDLKRLNTLFNRVIASTEVESGGIEQE